MFAGELGRGFTAVNPDYARLECAITEGWKELNECRHWVKCPGAAFEMKTEAEYQSCDEGTFSFRREILRFIMVRTILSFFKKEIFHNLTLQFYRSP